MNLQPAPDGSLYQLALKLAVQPLSLTAATLTSLSRALLDTLIEQQLPATIWAKLPPGQVWQEEIYSYHQRMSVPHTIYLCKGLGTGDKPLPSPQSNPQNSGDSRIIPIYLASDSPILREYFVLVLSEKFVGLILAHRPHRSKQEIQTISTDKDLAPGKSMELLEIQQGLSFEDSDELLAFNISQVATEKKTGLQAICSFDFPVIQQLLQGIRNAIAPNQENLSCLDKKLENLPQDNDFVQTKAIASILIHLLETQGKQEQNHHLNSTNDGTTAQTAALQRQNESLLDDLLFKNELLSNSLLELRTPLTNMKTALKLLESPNLKPAQRQRYMRLLHTECDRQTSLMSGLMELVQLDSTTIPINPPPVHLAEIVPGVVSTYQPLAQEKGIQLGYTISTNLPIVSCLESWLRQIVINLLHNSIKFTPTGGQVWVRSKQQGEYVQLEFRDTGIGIAPNELPKIFDRFYRGRPAAGEEVVGAGLGLTIVQQLLLRCGGSISVTSRLGQGSIFKVLLPIAN
ncbi:MULTISPECIES: DICT sensory domain-containing protein [Cyanophyceae]|uniref:DICT sensory domain-containing protein n=1 Tax=Cyanophyceae TaxID=3028117 RepID=UPI001684A81A|nr:DICT sensory domain-containing protein [Trichocoleus sp. FACHB-40]MBD2005051.1 hypothetical protein [Trichocoleus sp. FACHB-40]